MENEFQILIEAILDKTKIPKESLEVQKLIQKYPAEFEAKLKTSNLKKDTTEVKNYIKSLAKEMNIEIDDKQITSVLNSFVSKTQQLDAQITKTVEKINKFQTVGKINLDYSSAEKSYQSLEKVDAITDKVKTDFNQLKIAHDALGNSANDQELISNYTKFDTALKTVNNSLKQTKLDTSSVNSKTQQLDAQITKTVEKINKFQTVGKINLDYSSAEKSYQSLEKVDAITDKVKTDFNQLKIAHDALGNSANDQELISNYTKFDTALKTVNNSLKQTKLDTASVDSKTQQLDKVTFKNQVQAWNRINSNAKQFHSQMNSIISQIDSVDDKRGLTNLRKQFQSLNAEASALDVKGFNNTDKFKNAASKFTEWLAPPMLIMEFMQQIKNGATTIAEFDDAMTDVAYTSDITSTGLENLGNKSMQMAQDLHTSAKNILEAVKVYSTANSTADDILRKAQPAIMLTNVSGMSGAESSKTINTALNQFEIEDTEKGLLDIVDTLQYVSSQLNYDFTK